MSEHTPGPWDVFGKKSRFPGIESRIGSLVVYGTSEDDMGVRGDTQEEALANAYLMAAAPDLLKQAKREVEWLQHVRPQIQAPEAVVLGFDQAIKYLSAAISKAEGRT